MGEELFALLTLDGLHNAIVSDYKVYSDFDVVEAI